MTRRKQYFIKQKLIGVALIAMTVLSGFVLDYNFAMALFGVPVGLYLICTRNMVWMDDYYYEVKRRGEERRYRRTR